MAVEVKVYVNGKPAKKNDVRVETTWGNCNDWTDENGEISFEDLPSDRVTKFYVKGQMIKEALPSNGKVSLYL